MSDRVAALMGMLAKRPDDPRLRFGLAAEYEKLEQWDKVVEQLQAYLHTTDDQGNAWGRLALALRKLGREAEAATALQKGIDAARRHGHPSMAAEFEEMLEQQ